MCGEPPLTYVHLTYEFLATLECFFSTADEEGVCFTEGEHVYLNNPYFTFRLFNKSHSLTLAELNHALGFDPDSPLPHQTRGDEFDGYLPTTTWRVLTENLIFNPRRHKATHIIHPAIRYIHRMLIYMIYPRHALGTMSNDEVQALWLLTQPKQTPCPINFAYHFLDRALDHRVGKAHQKDINFGGMVTLIARHFPEHHAELARLIEVNGPQSPPQLDLRMIREKFGWLTEMEGGRYVWKVKGYDWCTLPNRAATSLEAPRPNPFHIPQDREPDQQELRALAVELQDQQRELAQFPTTTTITTTTTTTKSITATPTTSITF